MTIQRAKAVMQAVGPSRVLCVGNGAEELVRELLLSGCEAWQLAQGAHLAEVVALILSPDDAPIHALEAVSPALEAAETVVLYAQGQARSKVDVWLFARGWRRHPASLRPEQYEAMRDAVLPEVSIYQRIPAAAAHRWSVIDLLAERDLHMDMLREGGPRADAHIIRYALAARFIRPGDRVVDCACGLGYGTAVLASLSRGASFTGIDLDPQTVAYAQANYGRTGVQYQAGDAANLCAIPDASADVVVSMETIEHVPDWLAVLNEFRRILKPDGRLIASVPDQWVDESGHDPNPYHYHAFDWDLFSSALAERFIIEARFVQAAPGGFKLPRARRLLRQVPLDSPHQSEWILAVASVNPLEDGAERKAGFTHPAFAAACSASKAPVVDFAGSYDNPYLYRPLVQMGERLSDAERLYRLARLTISLARPGSADLGAALCVAGYQALEHRNAEVIAELRPLIADYLTGETPIDKTPHGVRWRLSLSVLAGRLASYDGETKQAFAWFTLAAEQDWQAFSPLLATKAIAACFYAGVLSLSQRADAQAMGWFQRGLELSLTALAQPSSAIIGDLQNPIPFAMQEMAEVSDMGGQCALALAHQQQLERDRGAFWRQIDVKRFGVVGWARDLERANQQLQQRLAAALADTPAERAFG